ncbi:nucleoside triphosphate pyrophosphohydrolase family protein [Psychrobacter namhaensis]|uniref:Nucleoside triphosphate pyrophosphohydrolase family protein n=1 Tax=Psychrobacter namhaensis TaxID=292734 RepID=A0ABW8L7G0_9GAMM
MSNLPLKALVWDWSYGDGGKTNAVCRAKSPSHEYIIRLEAGGDCYVDYRKFDNDEDSDNRKDEPPVFDSIKAAQDWAQSTHYPSKMQPYVKPESITDIANWFKAAKPEPTITDITTQIGCHYEEVLEMDVALKSENTDNKTLSDFYKDCNTVMSKYELDNINRIELLDALCDQIVTATGVAYMMGFDIEGALKEVIRSNNSKMVKGKFEFDENGKISKPDSYSKPDLTPFVKQGE